MMAGSAHSPPLRASYFTPQKSATGLTRSDSLNSLARAPFSVQLHRLTSLSLPKPDDLQTRILNTESPADALARLRNIAADVQKWINTASTVLSQLDADDDVEWAARGRESLAKVENAAKRFGEIVEMFLDAATTLSERVEDEVVRGEIKGLVGVMDEVTSGWSGVRELLRGLKEQVALSTEWMEIREILDDISSELDACANMVFELEERRHIALSTNSTSRLTAQPASTGSSPSSPSELDKLSCILEEHSNASPSHPHQTSLLRLSARIQPLRASLDFLKPRLSSFGTRAERTFPTALSEIVQRKNDLEKRWLKIENDWRGLSRELEEDEWVQVFKKVGKQATDMMDSVSRSMKAFNSYLPDTSPPFDLVEHYIAKKTYYPAAINRVLDVLDRGYKHRVTYNGDVGRSYDGLRDRWRDLQNDMRKLDETLNDLDTHDNVSDVSSQMHRLSVITEMRPRSEGSSSSTTTLTQVSPEAPPSRESSSIRSGSRVTSLPPRRRESLLPTLSSRNRSLSTTSSTSSREPRLNIPLFPPTSKSPTQVRPPSVLGTGTGGLIPIEARPRWNSSPKAVVLGSPPPKVPSVVVTPSRIPQRTSGRATPTLQTPNMTPIRPVQSATRGATTPKVMKRAVPASTGLGLPAATPNKRLTRMVSNPNFQPSQPAEAPPPVPKTNLNMTARRQTANFAGISPPKVVSPGGRGSGIPRPSTAQGIHRDLRSSSGPAINGRGIPQPHWRG